MIRPPGFRGAAFGAARDGDGRSDEAVRRRLGERLGIPAEWATISQVHGNVVAVAAAPGFHGDADALVTSTPGVPLAVATADCVPVVIEAEGAVAVVHAGWRGAAAGIVPAARDVLERLGGPARRAALGPAIGPCCYEVGPEVAGRFPDHTATTNRGTGSIDLVGVLRSQLADVPVWASGHCTSCGMGFHSHRRDATLLRQIALGWL